MMIAQVYGAYQDGPLLITHKWRPWRKPKGSFLVFTVIQSTHASWRGHASIYVYPAIPDYRLIINNAAIYQDNLKTMKGNQ